MKQEFETKSLVDVHGDDVEKFMADLIRRRGIRTIGICGPSGSGKTTFAGKLRKAVGENSMVLKIDDYWRYTRDEMAEKKLTGYDWATRDKDKCLDDLARLKAGWPIDRPVFDYVKERPTHRTVAVAAREVIILEATLDFTGLVEMMIFIYAPDEVLVSRRLARDARKTGFRDLAELETYLRTTSIPAYRNKLLPIMDKADFVIDTHESCLYEK